jgi:uncharacterized YigZ family protein
MLFEDTYLTINQRAEGVFKDKGSKFIAFAYPISSEANVKIMVARLKEEHTKANHFCWAMRLTADRSIFKLNDDGEPSGTAGRPILNTLLSKNITNVLVVVVRYFGGTLLGVPGLINAYKLATEEALKVATVVERTVNDTYRLDFNYPQMNEVMRVIKNDNITIGTQQFDNACTMQIAVRKGLVERLLGQLQKVDGVKATYLFTF